MRPFINTTTDPSLPGRKTERVRFARALRLGRIEAATPGVAPRNDPESAEPTPRHLAVRVASVEAVPR